MEINIIDDKKNPLLSRREIICMVTKKGTTPSKKDIATEVTNELKLKKECVFVDAVYQKYGRQASEVHVRVYDKKELVPGYEKPKKDTDSAEAKKEGASESKASEETKEEKPKDTPEKKEEPKKEEVKEENKETPKKEEKTSNTEKKEEVKEEKKEEKAPDTEKKVEAPKTDDTKKE